MFNATRVVGVRKKISHDDMILFIGIVMRQKCDPATQRLKHRCWTFASNPKGRAAPWFFGTSYWPHPVKQPDNHNGEGQKCTYYVSSIWPGGKLNKNLEPLLPHGVVGDEACTHKFPALCELPAKDTTEIAHTTERSTETTRRTAFTETRQGLARQLPQVTNPASTGSSPVNYSQNYFHRTRKSSDAQHSK